VGVLLLGYGLVPVVASTTAVRIGAYFLYRLNAYRIYPPLRVRWSLFRRDRLREVTGFSVYASIIDWANKLNYQLDEFVIGAFLGAAPVAVWTVGDRVISATQRLTNQLNGVLFPVVVESDVTNQQSRLQRVLLEGTRLSLATVLPIAIVLIVLAQPLIRGWVGQKMIESAAVIQILAFAVAFRVGTATSTTLLKGSGKVRYLAIVNIVTGVVNLALSAVLIRRFGLQGVAWGTLVPIAFSSMFLLFPAACRRVELTVLDAVRRAIWPPVWPAIVCGLVLLGTSRISSGTLLAVLVQAAGAGLLYELLFFGLAIGRTDRAQYAGKLKQLLRQRPGLAPAA
jgi:O-antigen/teichoic acid export membrane protein